MGQECIGTRWVMTYKANGAKAHLVAKGFQESHPIPSDSPTVARTAFRTPLGTSIRKCLVCSYHRYQVSLPPRSI